MHSRTTDDYEDMAIAGVLAVVEPSSWVGEPREFLGTFIDYFNTLTGWERFRALQFGIHHYCALGINPKEANNIDLAEKVMEILPDYLLRESVLAIGAVGFHEITAAEERFFGEQLELAKKVGLPVVVHTPVVDKLLALEKSIALIEEIGIDPEWIMLDHLDEKTIKAFSDFECWRCYTVFPKTRLSEIKMVELLKHYGTEKIMVSSAADWGVSDPLKVPKVGTAMVELGFTPEKVEKVLFDNPAKFYMQSQKITLSEITRPLIDQSHSYANNSALRGQTPMVERGASES